MLKDFEGGRQSLSVQLGCYLSQFGADWETVVLLCGWFIGFSSCDPSSIAVTSLINGRLLAALWWGWKLKWREVCEKGTRLLVLQRMIKKQVPVRVFLYLSAISGAGNGATGGMGKRNEVQISTWAEEVLMISWTIDKNPRISLSVLDTAVLMRAARRNRGFDNYRKACVLKLVLFYFQLNSFKHFLVRSYFKTQLEINGFEVESSCCRIYPNGKISSLFLIDVKYNERHKTKELFSAHHELQRGEKQGYIWYICPYTFWGSLMIYESHNYRLHWSVNLYLFAFCKLSTHNYSCKRQKCVCNLQG